jgi:hypothetical protein
MVPRPCRAPLREIGFDQNIDQRVPLDTTSATDGRDRPARRLLRQAARL